MNDRTRLGLAAILTVAAALLPRQRMDHSWDKLRELEHQPVSHVQQLEPETLEQARRMLHDPSFKPVDPGNGFDQLNKLRQKEDATLQATEEPGDFAQGLSDQKPVVVAHRSSL